MSKGLDAKAALDRLIGKARVHFYKPIQIAEILYRDRVYRDIDLADVETYRKESKHWRDVVSLRFLRRVMTSTAKYQDDLFSVTAMPPECLVALGRLNRDTRGGVEAYIYQRYADRLSSMKAGLDYCTMHSRETFVLQDFLTCFWNESGLRRSIDKIYEIVVYALASSLLEAIGVQVEVSIPSSGRALLADFEDFTRKIVGLDLSTEECVTSALLHRSGVTNAADRGLDMWGNFGVAIQVKHLSLTLGMAEEVVSEVRAERIVIVCKKAEVGVLSAIASKLGESRLQSIITEEELIEWYHRALRMTSDVSLGELIMQRLREEIELEFPALGDNGIDEFIRQRGYGETSSFVFVDGLE